MPVKSTNQPLNYISLRAASGGNVVPSGVQYIKWEVEEKDDFGAYDFATNPGIIKIPASLNGKKARISTFVKYSVTGPASTPYGHKTVITINGVDIVGEGRYSYTTDAYLFQYQLSSKIVELSTDDEIVVQVYGCLIHSGIFDNSSWVQVEILE